MSEDFQHLANAPIVEAIVDFRVRLPVDFDVARFKELHPQLQANYPTVEDRRLVEHKIEQWLLSPPLSAPAPRRMAQMACTGLPRSSLS